MYPCVNPLFQPRFHPEIELIHPINGRLARRR